jgi:hypothetical protein
MFRPLIVSVGIILPLPVSLSLTAKTFLKRVGATGDAPTWRHDPSSVTARQIHL